MNAKSRNPISFSGRDFVRLYWFECWSLFFMTTLVGEVSSVREPLFAPAPLRMGDQKGGSLQQVCDCASTLIGAALCSPLLSAMDLFLRFYFRRLFISFQDDNGAASGVPFRESKIGFHCPQL